jgi:hypothetical protein
LIFTKADKCNETVINNKEEYKKSNGKMIKSGPYEEVKFKDKYPLDKLQGELKQQVDKLEKKNIIDNKLKFSVKSPIIRHLYTFPKTHKPGNKTRPIISNVKVK